MYAHSNSFFCKLKFLLIEFEIKAVNESWIRVTHGIYVELLLLLFYSRRQHSKMESVGWG